MYAGKACRSREPIGPHAVLRYMGRSWLQRHQAKVGVGRCRSYLLGPGGLHDAEGVAVLRVDARLRGQGCVLLRGEECKVGGRRRPCAREKDLGFSATRLAWLACRPATACAECFQGDTQPPSLARSPMRMRNQLPY